MKRKEEMIWLTHKKYTAEYVSDQLTTIREKMHREMRRMILVAAAAVGAMIIVQTLCLVDLLSVS